MRNVLIAVFKAVVSFSFGAIFGLGVVSALDVINGTYKF